MNYLDINGLSRHLGDSDVPLREVNPGLGFTREKGSNIIKMLSAGGYRNSFDKNSLYGTAGLAKRFNLGDGLYTDLGAIAGAVTGYPGSSVMPMGGLYGSLGRKGGSKVRLMYGPKTERNNAVLMLNLGIPIR